MSVLPEDWALPAPTAITEAWFTSRTIAVQTCAECGSRQHPPEELCHRCGAMSFTYPALSPNGTLHSYTVAHYAVNRALAPHVPYAVVLDKEGLVAAKGLVNSREQLDSLLNAHDMGQASIQQYLGGNAA